MLPPKRPGIQVGKIVPVTQFHPTEFPVQPSAFGRVNQYRVDPESIISSVQPKPFTYQYLDTNDPVWEAYHQGIGQPEIKTRFGRPRPQATGGRPLSQGDYIVSDFAQPDYTPDQVNWIKQNPATTQVANSPIPYAPIEYQQYGNWDKPLNVSPDSPKSKQEPYGFGLYQKKTPNTPAQFTALNDPDEPLYQTPLYFTKSGTVRQYDEYANWGDSLIRPDLSPELNPTYNSAYRPVSYTLPTKQENLFNYLDIRSFPEDFINQRQSLTGIERSTRAGMANPANRDMRFDLYRGDINEPLPTAEIYRQQGFVPATNFETGNPILVRNQGAAPRTLVDDNAEIFNQAVGERTYSISDQLKVEDYFRQELGDKVPNHPYAFTGVPVYDDRGFVKDFDYSSLNIPGVTYKPVPIYGGTKETRIIGFAPSNDTIPGLRNYMPASDTYDFAPQPRENRNIVRLQPESKENILNRRINAINLHEQEMAPQRAVEDAVRQSVMESQLIPQGNYQRIIDAGLVPPVRQAVDGLYVRDKSTGTSIPFTPKVNGKGEYVIEGASDTPYFPNAKGELPSADPVTKQLSMLDVDYSGDRYPLTRQPSPDWDYKYLTSAKVQDENGAWRDKIVSKRGRFLDSTEFGDGVVNPEDALNLDAMTALQAEEAKLKRLQAQYQTNLNSPTVDQALYVPNLDAPIINPSQSLAAQKKYEIQKAKVEAARQVYNTAYEYSPLPPVKQEVTIKVPSNQARNFTDRMSGDSISVSEDMFDPNLSVIKGQIEMPAGDAERFYRDARRTARGYAEPPTEQQIVTKPRANLVDLEAFDTALGIAQQHLYNQKRNLTRNMVLDQLQAPMQQMGLARDIPSSIQQQVYDHSDLDFVRNNLEVPKRLVMSRNGEPFNVRALSTRETQLPEGTLPVVESPSILGFEQSYEPQVIARGRINNPPSDVIKAVGDDGVVRVVGKRPTTPIPYNPERNNELSSHRSVDPSVPVAKPLSDFYEGTRQDNLQKLGVALKEPQFIDADQAINAIDIYEPPTDLGAKVRFDKAVQSYNQQKAQKELAQEIADNLFPESQFINAEQAIANIEQAAPIVQAQPSAAIPRFESDEWMIRKTRPSNRWLNENQVNNLSNKQERQAQIEAASAVAMEQSLEKANGLWRNRSQIKPSQIKPADTLSPEELENLKREWQFPDPWTRDADPYPVELLNTSNQRPMLALPPANDMPDVAMDWEIFKAHVNPSPKSKYPFPLDMEIPVNPSAHADQAGKRLEQGMADAQAEQPTGWNKYIPAAAALGALGLVGGGVAFNSHQRAEEQARQQQKEQEAIAKQIAYQRMMRGGY